MLRRLLLTAVVAGAVGGAAATLLQSHSVVPLILHAETFETAAEEPTGTEMLAHDHAGHEHAAEAWQPEDGLERAMFTGAANILTAVGFAMLLVACFSLRDRPVGFGQGLLWGLAGFVAFNAAPALGLPPELPGMTAAPLADRQIWWLATVVATMAGLALIVFARHPAAKAVGVALLLLPHLAGAPHADLAASSVPAELAAQFVTASFGGAAVLWLVLGGVSGWLFSRTMPASAGEA